MNGTKHVRRFRKSIATNAEKELSISGKGDESKDEEGKPPLSLPEGRKVKSEK